MGYLLRQLDGAFHLCAAACNNDARRDQLLEATATQLVAYQAEEFFVPWLDDLGERLSRQPARRPLTYARHLDRFVRVREL